MTNHTKQTKNVIETVHILKKDQQTTYLIGSDLFDRLDTLPVFSSLPSPPSILFLADSTVFDLFGTRVLASLSRVSPHIRRSIIPAGEKEKQLGRLPSLLSPYFSGTIHKHSVFVSLGGGVVTDIGNFAASILLRGIRCVHLPTTLLGQIDAAVGGKGGVDYWDDSGTMYKNMIGTIAQPVGVISDVSALDTLPEREITNGLGEMVKYWVGWGRPSKTVLSSMRTIGTLSYPQRIAAIASCQRIKTEIIRRDPYEDRGLRQQLNLGHTIGHAIEGAARGRYSHGEAVAIGVWAATRISVLSGLLREDVARDICDTLRSLRLPMQARHVALAHVREAMRMDKKGGSFVLPVGIGSLQTNVSVNPDHIAAVLSEILVS